MEANRAVGLQTDELALIAVDRSSFVSDGILNN